MLCGRRARSIRRGSWWPTARDRRPWSHGDRFGRLAVLGGGVAPSDAVAWARANYCSEAVATPEQEAFVAGPGH